MKIISFSQYLFVRKLKCICGHKLWQFPSHSAARHSQEARVIHSCLGNRDGTVPITVFFLLENSPRNGALAPWPFHDRAFLTAYICLSKMHFICSPNPYVRRGTYDSLTHCKICPESRVCQIFLPGATRTHRPLPLTELNTACFRESPSTDFGKVPRSVNPVILCHWHNELNTSKYHFQKQKHK